MIHWLTVVHPGVGIALALVLLGGGVVTLVGFMISKVFRIFSEIDLRYMDDINGGEL